MAQRSTPQPGPDGQPPHRDQKSWQTAMVALAVVVSCAIAIGWAANRYNGLGTTGASDLDGSPPVPSAVVTSGQSTAQPPPVPPNPPNPNTKPPTTRRSPPSSSPSKSTFDTVTLEIREVGGALAGEPAEQTVRSGTHVKTTNRSKTRSCPLHNSATSGPPLMVSGNATIPPNGSATFLAESTSAIMKLYCNTGTGTGTTAKVIYIHITKA